MLKLGGVSRDVNRNLGHRQPRWRPEQTDSRRIYHVLWQDAPPPPHYCSFIATGWKQHLVGIKLSGILELHYGTGRVSRGGASGVSGESSLRHHQEVKDKFLKQSPSQMMLKNTPCLVLPASPPCAPAPQVYWDFIFPHFWSPKRGCKQKVHLNLSQLRQGCRGAR